MRLSAGRCCNLRRRSYEARGRCNRSFTSMVNNDRTPRSGSVTGQGLRPVFVGTRTTMPRFGIGTTIDAPASAAPGTSPRRQGEARHAAAAAYPFRCCVICGLQIGTCLTVAHLDHNPGNNVPDNLAYLCPTHHWMYDAGLYPSEAIKIVRAHWQQTRGVPSHAARMKGAGARAALTRKRSAAARKAWEARRPRREPEPSAEA
jgi:hypothetical protein